MPMGRNERESETLVAPDSQSAGAAAGSGRGLFAFPSDIVGFANWICLGVPPRAQQSQRVWLPYGVEIGSQA